MKILCICNQGENRSRTTSDILNVSGVHEAKYDGFYKDRFNEESNTRETFEKGNLSWADKIIVFEKNHEELLKKHGYAFWGKSYNFEIEDLYHYNQGSLRKLIMERLKHYELL